MIFHEYRSAGDINKRFYLFACKVTDDESEQDASRKWGTPLARHRFYGARCTFSQWHDVSIDADILKSSAFRFRYASLARISRGSTF